MDTISRENNSMLPVGGIIVGVIGLVLGAFALIQASKANKAIADHQVKIDKIDAIETKVDSVATTAERAKNDGVLLGQQTQKAFNDVGGMLSEFRGTLTKLEEASKKAPPPVAGKKGGEPAVAGPGEYVVKSGDGSGTKIAAANGVSIKALQDVNPGVDWNHLKVGQKLKLPKK